MDEKYLKYSLEELLDDSDFIDYLLQGNRKADWEVLTAASPEFKKMILKSREILRYIQDTNDNITDVEKLKLWNKIEQFDNLNRKNKDRNKLYFLLGYAAAFVLLIFLVAIVRQTLEKKFTTMPGKFPGSVHNSAIKIKPVQFDGELLAVGFSAINNIDSG